MPMNPVDPVAWSKGFLAGAQGNPTPCPYPASSPEAWAWFSGAIEGTAKWLGHGYSLGSLTPTQVQEYARQ
jgi:hypothetical protein